MCETEKETMKAAKEVSSGDNVSRNGASRV